jgi:hypothetical protein
MKSPKMILAIVAAGLLMAASSALADDFTLNSDHCTGGCGPQTGGFGNVNLTQVGANVLVTVSLINGNQFISTGAGGGDAFLFNGPAGLVITNISSNGGPLLTPDYGTPTIHADGTGNFNYGIACLSCNGASNPFSGPITFLVLNTTVAALEVQNDTGNFFAADILSGTTGKTGDVDASSVADGGTTLMLLGSALSALGLARRFFWR